MKRRHGKRNTQGQRFGANYGGPDGAQYVRDATAAWAERELGE